MSYNFKYLIKWAGLVRTKPGADSFRLQKPHDYIAKGNTPHLKSSQAMAKQGYSDFLATFCKIVKNNIL